MLCAGALLGVTGVVLGAYGAHGLAAVADAGALSSWNTAVDYQLIHAVVLLILGVWQQQDPGNRAVNGLRWAGYFLIAGVLFFSGSIYFLVFGGPRFLGPVTPIGGTLLIAGWLAITWVALLGNRDRKATATEADKAPDRKTD